MKGYKTPEKKRIRAKEYYWENRDKVLAYQKQRWSKKFKEDQEFRKKRLFRDRSRYPKRKIEGNCTKCSSGNDLQRHHPTYESTAFIVMCRNCHNELHRELKEVGSYSLELVRGVT